MKKEIKDKKSPALLPIGNLEDELIEILTLTQENEVTNNNTETNKTLLFRGKPISWVTVPKTQTITRANAFGDDDIEEVTKKICHLIQYDGRQMGRDEFLKYVFPDYRKYSYKVRFKTDDIFRLGGN